MGPSQKLLWKIYVGVLGAVATIAAQKGLEAAWKGATGDEPPSPTDPKTPLAQAVIWALASGVGVGVVQLLANRFAANRWQASMGVDAPDLPKINFKA